MAKKNKKSAQRHKQRQQKQQRRSNRVAKRGIGDYHSSTVGTTKVNLDSQYVLDLKRVLGTGEISEERSVELFELAFTSEYLIDEPEFEKIGIAPLKAMGAYIKSAVELGFEDPAELDKLPEEERTEKYEEILIETSKKIINPEIKSDVVAGLTRLRQRLRAARKVDDLESAAAAQFLIEQDSRGELSHSVGVVRALVKRAVANGFELSQAVGMDRDDPEDEGLSALEFYNRMTQNNDPSAIEALLQRPGMESALDEQLNEIWSEAGKALLSGELDLHLYSEEELEEASEIWQEVQENSTGEEESIDSAAFVKALHEHLTEYLRNLFAPERASELQARINEVAHDPAYGSSAHVPFLLMLQEDLANEFDFDLFSFILFQALIGELRAFIDLEEDEEVEDRED